MESSDPQRQPPVSGGTFVVCIAGPDHGKRVMVATSTLFVGRASDSNVLSDDPDVTERFASLVMDGNRVRVLGLSQPLPFVDGHAVTEAFLTRGQQLRLGRSLWEVQVPGGGPSVLDFVNRMGDHLSNAAGIEKPAEWSAREMFADVAKKHGDDEIEAYFTVGTVATTPALHEIDASWPRPWVFVRVFALSLALYLGFVWAWNTFDNTNLIPGLIMVGSVAVPLSLLIFFFEVNVPHNVSLYQVIKLLLTGGLVSIVISLFFFQWTGLSNWLGAASAGIIEESGKALTLLLVVRKLRFRWTLNGLLLGATVGTGFAVFETAGYALRAALSAGGGAQAMRDVLMQRGILSVLGGHVLWTALVGAALWRVRGDRPFSRDMLFDGRFLRVLGVCMVMHMIWNSNFTVPLFGDFGKYLVLGAAAWLLVLGMVQSGLKQVREAQAALTSSHGGIGSAA